MILTKTNIYEVNYCTYNGRIVSYAKINNLC